MCFLVMYNIFTLTKRRSELNYEGKDSFCWILIWSCHLVKAITVSIHIFAIHRWKSQFTVRGIQLLSVVYKNKLFANLEIRGRHLEVNFCNADSELLFCAERCYIQIMNWRYNRWMWVDLEVWNYLLSLSSSHSGGFIILSMCKCIKL